MISPDILSAAGHQHRGTAADQITCYIFQAHLQMFTGMMNWNLLWTEK